MLWFSQAHKVLCMCVCLYTYKSNIGEIKLYSSFSAPPHGLNNYILSNEIIIFYKISMESLLFVTE